MPIDLIQNEDSQLGKLVKTLESAGYTVSEDGPETLGHKEYHLCMRAGRKMLTLGMGRIGEEGCYVVFYFMIDSEELVEHAAFDDA